MAETARKDRPDFKNRIWSAMAPAWKVVQDIARGTLHLRSLAKTYLPQFPAEHAKDYKDRVATATFFNAYLRTVQGLVGMVFKKNPTLSEDVPPRLKQHAENINLAGDHLDVFSKQAFEDMFDGHVFILVDMQKALGDGATLEDEQRAGLRPYWVKYRASQAVNFRPTTINGALEIGQITFEEESCAPDGEYGEKQVKRYRTFTLVEYTDIASRTAAHFVLFKLQELRKDEAGQEYFFPLDEGVIKGFARIPVAVAYGRKTGFLQSQPPLIDLALLNVSYFQKRSDYDQSLHKCGNPVPVFSGVPEDWKLLGVGAGFGIKLPKDATATYMEPEGNALEAARLDLQETRGEMASLGLSVLAAPAQAEKTATETVIDFAQESSELETMARSFGDALEMCLGFHAQYLGEKSGGSASVGAHLKSMRLSQQQLDRYSSMVEKDQLSLDTLWEIMQTSDALPDTFDPEREQERIDKQRESVGSALLKAFDRGGAPVGGNPVGGNPAGTGA